MEVSLRIGTELGQGVGGSQFKTLESYNWDPTVSMMERCSFEILTHLSQQVLGQNWTLAPNIL